MEDSAYGAGKKRVGVGGDAMGKIGLTQKTILVTGVAGFIGSNLAKKIVEEIEEVSIVGIDNMNDYYDVELKESRLNELKNIIILTL